MLLPRNADLGNLWRDLGTVPCKLLLDKFRSCNLGKRRSGISPESELFARFKPASSVKSENEEGIMLPLKQLLDKLTTVRFFQTEKSGKGPDRLLNWRYRKDKFLREEKSEGKWPLIRLDLRLKISSAERRLIVLGGIEP